MHIESIKTRREDIIGFRMDSTTTEADMQVLLRQLKSKIQDHRKVRLIIEYVDMNGFSMDTLQEVLTAHFGQLSYFEKTALITAREHSRQASSYARQADMPLRNFHFSEKRQAYRWLEE